MTTRFFPAWQKVLMKMLLEVQPASTLVKPACWLESNEAILLLARPQLLGLDYGQQEKKSSPISYWFGAPVSPSLFPGWKGGQKPSMLLEKMKALHFPRSPCSPKEKLRACQCLTRPPTGKELDSPGRPSCEELMEGRRGRGAAAHP